MNRLSIELIGAAVLLLLAFLAGWFVNGDRWQAKYDVIIAANAQAATQALDQAKAATDAQLQALKDTTTNNSQVIERLQNENAQIAADRDANLALARRLLSAQAKPPPSSSPVPEASGGQPVAPASGTGSDRTAQDLLVATADECVRNANRLDALIAEIRPQL